MKSALITLLEDALPLKEVIAVKRIFAFNRVTGPQTIKPVIPERRSQCLRLTPCPRNI